MARNEQSFILIYSNDTFDVYYDKDTKRYHIDAFDDGHYWDEVWFDEYKEEIISNPFEKNTNNEIQEHPQDFGGLEDFYNYYNRANFPKQ